MASTRVDLSVTIVSFNTLELTRCCLNSIIDSTKSISYEVWVVDNNSSDGSPEMIEREFPWVHLVRNDANKGLAAATNQGLEPSAGRYLMALNSDTIVTPGAFDSLVRFMDDHPEVGGGTPKLVLPGGGKHPIFVGAVPNLKIELLEALSPLITDFSEAVRRARYEPEIDYSVTQEVPCVTWGTAFVVRREVFDQIGGQDPRYFVYSEDVDWSMRIGKAGWKLFYMAEAEIIHYGGQSTKQSATKMSAQLLRSRCRMIQKHYGFLAGLILRTAYVAQLSTRTLKWVIIYVVHPRKRHDAASRISHMWTVIRAITAY